MSITARAADTFAQQGGSFVEPPVLMEAAIPLELSGEAVRNRICTFVDPQGKEWALRPDLTLPIAVAEVDARRRQDPGETLRRYKGKVFRLPTVETEPVEYEQVGIERFGAPRSVEQDVWLFETLTSVCSKSGMETGHICFGDLSVFPAFIDALAFPDDVAAGIEARVSSSWRGTGLYPRSGTQSQRIGGGVWLECRRKKFLHLSKIFSQ